MKRRSFFGAIGGLFGGWCLGTQLKAQPISLIPKKLPLRFDSEQKFEFSHTMMLAGTEWQIYRRLDEGISMMLDLNGCYWMTQKPIKYYSQIIFDGKDTAQAMYNEVIPNQVVHCKALLWPLHRPKEATVVTLNSHFCMVLNYTHKA